MFSQNLPNPKDPNSQYSNPELQEALSWLNESNYWWFYMSTQELIDEEDFPLFKRSGIIIGRNILFSLGLGIVLNVQIKRVPGLNFLNWNKGLRWFCRGPLFVLPYFAGFHWRLQKEYSKFYGYHLKYYKRIKSFQKTGDLRYLDPKGKMLQRM